MRKLPIYCLLPIMLLLTGCYSSIRVPINTYKPAYTGSYRVPIITPIGDTIQVDLDYFMKQVHYNPQPYIQYKIYHRGYWVSPWVYRNYYYYPAIPQYIYRPYTPAPPRVKTPPPSKPRPSGTTRKNTPQTRKERPAREAKRNN